MVVLKVYNMPIFALRVGRSEQNFVYIKFFKTPRFGKEALPIGSLVENKSASYFRLVANCNISATGKLPFSRPASPELQRGEPLSRSNPRSRTIYKVILQTFLSY